MANPSLRKQIDDHIVEHLDDFIQALGRLCAQPSISATGEGIDQCADLVAGMLDDYGYKSEIMPTAGNPVVFAQASGKSDKTLLFYLHYDVQPPEPIEAWQSPPFELTRRGDNFYARGSADDKGHIIARLAALAAIRHVLGELPCNVKFVVEGEEELGSPSMPDFVAKNDHKLSADGCIWEFGGVDYDGVPTLSLGMRGICYVELFVKTADLDAHSGLGGSIFPNAAWRLVWALKSLKNEDEYILIPGFYDNVLPPTSQDLEYLSRLPDDAEKIRAMYGLKHFLRGLSGGLDFKKAAVFEPTCTICGLSSGYQGPGSKTVIPADARAKVDFRLVPDQTPEEILRKLRQHLDSLGFSDVEIQYNGGTRPMIGGSGPNYPFIHTLELPVVSAGIAYPGTNAHAPNEHFRLNDFIQGIRHTAYIVEAFANN
jgi:acetylornithine deacetylase/succinyl-diaminopimelate desuccinylase-like protein